MPWEFILMWGAITLYAAGTAMFAFGVVFEREGLTRKAVWVSALGLLPQSAALIVRWTFTGHGPALGLYEAASTLLFASLSFFVLLAWRRPDVSPAGIVLMPVVLLLLGGAMLAPKSGSAISSTLATYWLTIHVLFSNLAFASFVLSFALAVVFIIRERSADGAWARRLSKMPAQAVIEYLGSRFVIVGFLFWGVMIASGAVWANQAWGRYWAWDPIETWSLVVWIIYAVYLHLRLTLGWRGERIAWVAVISMPLAVFALLGVPFVWDSVHAGYVT